MMVKKRLLSSRKAFVAIFIFFLHMSIVCVVKYFRTFAPLSEGLWAKTAIKRLNQMYAAPPYS